ncbi:MAG: outer membrane beta-barrel protein, partial [Verrucomicrobiota bacterium]|nr:outer membrane beta-barrel protein [Verrucomicrobiota bacterium]
TSTTGVGLETSYVFTNYDKNLLNDNNAFSVGGFVETQLTNYLKVRVAGGYQMINFDSSVVLFGPLPPDGRFIAFNDNRDLNDYYINALFSHRVNSALTHRLSVGHESQLGVNSNYITLNYVRHTANWNIINRTLLSTELFYEDADDSGGFVDEHQQRYGGALSLGYQLTRHVTLGARYQYTKKNSNVPLRDYSQNRVSIDGTYSF